MVEIDELHILEEIHEELVEIDEMEQIDEKSYMFICIENLKQFV